MTSLRRRLFLILIASTGIVWLTAVAWIYLSSRMELERVLDHRLQEAARMVHSLVMTGDMTAATQIAPLQPVAYDRQLSCQIWSLDGRLVARSSGAPEGELADRAGFTIRRVDGEMWRVFTIVDADKGVRVAVGDRVGLRDRLVRDLIAGLLAPALAAIPILGLMLWASLGRGLRPLNAVAGEIAGRDAEDMRPIPPTGAPAEIRPLIAAINGLFGKVEAARKHEREVTAFAAHELRTPLAGLRTQAQVALAAPDAATREGALRQILVSVDRTARLTRQLLALAKLEAAPAVEADTVAAGALVREIAEAVPRRAGVGVEIAGDLDALRLSADREALHLLIRNLHENAVEHTRDGGTVRWHALPGGAGVAVDDEGPGIPEEELGLVTRRFYRGKHRGSTGTGLGLTIAAMAARRVGAELVLRNRDAGGGLHAAVAWRPAAE